jgi:hydroxymethylpyrimidine/phosphomethylpyrimidine kinase
MLYSAGLTKVVARELQKYGAKNIVLDPVMVAESGDKLLKDSAIHAIKKYMMLLADIITPNIPEAEVLTGHAIANLSDMKNAAKKISANGGKCVLIKGGHFKGGESTDLLFIAPQKRFVIFKGERIHTKNTHGTGCTLSSAIAAFMAKGDNIETAVNKAKTYIGSAIKAGAQYELGQGKGPVHHFFDFW